ncbi:MAG: TAXI family TRAP transporter solute-binding subunit [Geminicoccaceae bacterium]
MSVPIDAIGEAQYELIVCDDPGSAAHAVGIGLELLIKLELMPAFSMNVASTTRSSDSGCLARMRDKTSTFAIMDRTVMGSERKGLHSSGDQPDIRPLLIAALWQQAAHFVIAKDHLLSGTIGDFALLSTDQLIVDPALLSGASQLLAKAGIMVDQNADDLPPAWPEALVERFNRGVTVGVAVLEPVPSAPVTEFLAKTGDRAILLELSARHILADGVGWQPVRIPASIYPHIDRPIETFGDRFMLVAEADVADEAVYQVTKIMFDNLPRLRLVHEIATQISIDHALEDAALPLHPGAARYYREIGVLPYEAGASKNNRAVD